MKQLITAATVLVLILSGAAAFSQDGQASSAEKAFITSYMDKLHFMVYIDEKTKVAAQDEYLYRKAVTFANDFLSKKNVDVVLLDQIENLKKDHTTLVEDVKGENLSVVQWLAQKLNADVYIVIDLLVQSEKRGTQFYAQANVSLTAFEASTGRMLASKSYNQLDKSLGSSEEFAKTNAVAACINRIMEELLRTTRDYMSKAIERGIRYELFIVDTADAKTLLNFINGLKTRTPVVKSVESVYRTDTEGKYYVYMFGLPEDFEAVVYSIAETVPGLEGLKLVSQRGKSFTFTTGM